MTREEWVVLLNEVLDARESRQGTLQLWLLGALKSWTIWASGAVGTFIELWPTIYATLQEQWPATFTAEGVHGLPPGTGAVITVIFIMLRQKTKTSLVEKGKK
jgi:hypothetical protein